MTTAKTTWATMQCVLVAALIAQPWIATAPPVTPETVNPPQQSRAEILGARRAWVRDAVDAARVAGRSRDEIRQIRLLGAFPFAVDMMQREFTPDGALPNLIDDWDKFFERLEQLLRLIFELFGGLAVGAELDPAPAPGGGELSATARNARALVDNIEARIDANLVRVIQYASEHPDKTPPQIAVEFNAALANAWQTSVTEFQSQHTATVRGGGADKWVSVMREYLTALAP